MERIYSTPRGFTPGPTPDEQVKMQKDGLDVLADIYRYAKEGFQAIAPEDLGLFKWYGLYLQRPKTSGYFMLRLRLPGGQIDARQLEVVAGIAEDYGHGFCDVTTRQTFQYHWLTIDQVPDIFSRLESVGLSSMGACGDTGRNVVGCPLAGISHDEILDATPQLEEVNYHLFNNKEFSNLPRKYKVSVSGCHLHCAQPDINCLGFFGQTRVVNGVREVGYGMKIGGGLSSAPHLAQVVPVFLKPEEVLPMTHYTTIVFRDFGYRQKRNRARFKFLVADWGAERVLEKVEEISGLRFDRHTDFDFPSDPETDHVGIHEQKQPGLYHAGIVFPGGRVRASQLRAIAAIAKEFAEPGKDAIRATNKQNLILLNIPERNLAGLRAALDREGLVHAPSNFRQGCVSCTGIEYCNLAVAETKNRMMTLVDQLESECSHYKEKIRIHFSGCPSSCGQHQVADIGFRGGKTKIDGQMVDAFDMFIGGKLGADPRFAEFIKSKVPSTRVHEVVGQVLRHYESHRLEGEAFADYARRVPKEDFKAVLELEAATSPTNNPAAS